MAASFTKCTVISAVYPAVGAREGFADSAFPRKFLGYCLDQTIEDRRTSSPDGAVVFGMVPSVRCEVPMRVRLLHEEGREANPRAPCEWSLSVHG